MLDESLRGIFLGLTRRHQERPVAALKEQQLSCRLLQECVEPTRLVDSHLSKPFHSLLSAMDQWPHPLGVHVHPGEMSTTCPPARLRQIEYPIWSMRLDDAARRRQLDSRIGG